MARNDVSCIVKVGRLDSKLRLRKKLLRFFVFNIKKVNEIIKADFKIWEEFIPRVEAERQFNLERLPEDVGDTIRIIKIGDYDACPCIGVHVKSSREIGSFNLISSDYKDGVLRLRFRLD